MKSTSLKIATLAAAGHLLAFNAFAADAVETQPAAPATADTASLREQLDELRQQIAIIERKAELKNEDDTAKAKDRAIASFNDEGFTVSSADKNFQLRIKGLVQTDFRHYFDDGGAAGATDKFVLRRARPIIEATLGKDYDAVLVPEFGDTPTKGAFLLDAYLNAAPFGKGAQLRFGKQRSTIGYEMNQADPKGFFIERSLATQLTTNRDLGIALLGKPLDDVIEYQIGVFNGAPDGAAPDYNGDVSDSKSIAARIFVKPFSNGSNYILSNLGAGFGADWREKTGTAGTATASGAFNNGLFNYRSDAQQTIFNWNAASFSNGESYRFSPHVGWYAGPFGLMAEYIVSENAVTNGIRNDTIRNKAWHIGGSWVITGENAAYEGVKPSAEHSVYNKGFGAVELVARIAQVDFDKDAFIGGATTTAYANPRTSASRATSYATGVNWYPSNNLRFSADYTHTDFEANNPTAAVLIHGEDALLFRAQISF